MSDEKRSRNAVEPTAPLYPTAPADNEHANLVTQQPPPPPYYQPLPPLNPTGPVLTPSAIYITPMNAQLQVGSGPSRLRCPNCHADIVTQTKHKSGCLTWAICGSICAIGLFAPCAWLGCQFIPFCIDSCKDVQHHCSNCRTYIGTFDRMK